jgi:hypothetical protein
MKSPRAPLSQRGDFVSDAHDSRPQSKRHFENLQYSEISYSVDNKAKSKNHVTISELVPFRKADSDFKTLSPWR